MLPLVVLPLVLLLFGSIFVAAALVIGRKMRLALEQRVNLVATSTEAPVAPDVFGGLLKVQMKKFDAKVHRIFTLGIKRTWAMQINSLTLLLVAAVSYVGAWLMAHRLFGFPALLATALSLPAAFFIPRFFLKRQQKQAELEFTDLFPDAVDTVSRMLRAGLPMTAAIRHVAKDGLPPVSTVFATIGDQLEIGIPIEDALDVSSREIGLPDFRFFTVAVALQYATGGNLTTTLEILSDIVRKRRAARLKVKATTGEIRITAYTLAAIPILTTGSLILIQPGYLMPLWRDPRGHVIIATAVVFLVLSYISMRTMMRSVTNG
ncbi:MAG: type II secretion system F family protein [Methylovirgula sp.]